jgi:glycosyltransferase involved in cell wall biosynthesis
MKEKEYISFFIASLRIGGAERAIVNLANKFSEKGFKIDVVLVEKTGELIEMLNNNIRVVDCEKKHARYSINAFRKYLTQNNPETIIVVQTHVQMAVYLAIVLSGWNGKLILNEQSTFTHNFTNKLFRFILTLMYKRADAITAVSQGAADDLYSVFPAAKNKITVINNPVFTEDILIKKDLQPEHDFFRNKNKPVVLSAGRLTASKNYKYLLETFSLVLKQTEALLIILGEGKERNNLEQYSVKLGISSFVSFHGNFENPYSFMNACDVFVLSSIYEGLPSVLIEALACGCNIVSTDCPNGPSEILQYRRLGSLVKLNDPDSFASEIIRNIKPKENQEAKLTRARDFSSEKISEKYISLINSFSPGN